MTAEAIITTDKIDAIFFREMRGIIEKKVLGTMSEKYMLVDVNEIGKGISENDKSFGIQFLQNTFAQKKIEWQFVVYIDFYGGDRFLTNMKIYNTDDFFPLKWYCTFRNILFPEKFEKGQQVLSIIKNWNEAESYIIEYLSFVKEIINKDEIQKILFTDYWIDVPIDYSPYK